MRLVTTPPFALPTQQIEPRLTFPAMRFDRRLYPRVPREGTAMAAFYDDDGAVALTRVELVDASLTGLGLRSTMPIPVGARVSVYFQNIPLAHSTGRVVRCDVDTTTSPARAEASDDAESDTTTYRLGLALDTTPQTAA